MYSNHNNHILPPQESKGRLSFSVAGITLSALGAVYGIILITWIFSREKLGVSEKGT